MNGVCVCSSRVDGRRPVARPAEREGTRCARRAVGVRVVRPGPEEADLEERVVGPVVRAGA